ncbi:hypothetical protein ACIRQP_14830 [Streptomyces sp. NPDC102274]|uniref:hypothetical protein n=1 Tax=Streptomyces sp. NPDC102274 TaxID=3366151 RepID=UPI00380388B4
MTGLILKPQTEDTHYGIPVVHIGEDGAMLALGHHTPRRALAAFNRHARVFVGLANLADDRSVRAADYIPLISQRHGIFRKPDRASEWEDPDWEWVVVWSVPEHPDAQPITVLDI